MTEKKQISIYDLLPLLKPGWVAMDSNGEWWWFKKRPTISVRHNYWSTKGDCDGYTDLIEFNVAPFDDDWKDSLMESGK